jgi:hypothetical protein
VLQLCGVIACCVRCLLCGLVPPVCDRASSADIKRGCAGAQNELTFPAEPAVTPQCKSIISQLLVKDETQRLGYKYGAEDIKRHPFFRDIRWQLLRSRTPPYVPRASSTTSARPVPGF